MTRLTLTVPAGYTDVMNGKGYALFGMTPAQIAAPETTLEAQEIVRQASGQTIIPWGGGARQQLGYPPLRYDLALSTMRLTRMVEYQPADLTVTAEAGMTLAALQEALAAHGQYLPLDIALPQQQTLGGIIATRADSLRRMASGSVRDNLLGVSVINSQGEWIKGGGRVMKNVSGYDLPKLYCGSLGTLGLIVEATFKVAPLPESSATVILPLEAEYNSEDALDSLLSSDLSPSFVCLLNSAAASDILPVSETSQYIIIGFDGNAEAVAWQGRALGAEALNPEAANSVRTALRDFPLLPSPMSAAFHILSSQVGAFSRMLEWTAHRVGFTARVVSDAALGIMTAHFTPARDDADWRAFYFDLKDKADRCGGSFIVARMPDELRDHGTDVWSPLLPDFALMRRMKEIIDPDGMWNPGRFVGRL